VRKLIDKEKLGLAIQKSYCYEDICFYLNRKRNTHFTDKIKYCIQYYNFDISHFNRNIKRFKNKRINKKCPICNKEFEIILNNRKERKYCSRYCANRPSVGDRYNKINNEKRYNTYKTYLLKKKEEKRLIEEEEKRLEQKLKIPLSASFHFKNRILKNKIRYTHNGKHFKIFCKNCGKEHITNRSITKFCSAKCVSNFHIKNKTHKGWKSRNIISYPEQFFIKVLNKNGFEGKYKINYPITKKSLGINCSSCYFLDFYFPDLNLDLEIDGKQHNYQERLESDNKRDLTLKENGYKIYRIKWKNINREEGKKYISEEIIKLLDLLNK